MGVFLGVYAWREADLVRVAEALVQGRLQQVAASGAFLGLVVGLYGFLIAGSWGEQGNRIPQSWWGWSVYGLVAGAASSGFLAWALN